MAQEVLQDSALIECLRGVEGFELSRQEKKRLAEIIDAVPVPSFQTLERYSYRECPRKAGQEYIKTDHYGLRDSITERFTLACSAQSIGVNAKAFRGRLFADFYTLATNKIDAKMVGDMLSITTTVDERALVVCKAFEAMQSPVKQQPFLETLQAAKIDVVTAPNIALKPTPKQQKLNAAVEELRVFGFVPFY